MSIRQAFVKRFGEREALAIETAANEHKNGVHDKQGSDPFKWALLICIGYQCMELGKYRKYHGINAKWPDLKKWIKRSGHLDSHDGDFDYVALVAGVYNEYMPKKRKAA